MPTDISTKTTNIIFDKEISTEIISKAIDKSAIMQLAQTMEIAGNGKKYQTIEGDPVPEWVGETEPKPIGKFSFGLKEVEPYKLAIIVPFSMEFREDKKALYDECVNRLPKLFGPKIDSTVMSITAPGANFDVLGDAQTVSMTPTGNNTLYDQFVAADELIGTHDGIMSGIALSPRARSKVLAAKDGQGRPLFTAGVQSGTINPILGAGVQVAKGVYAAGSPAKLGLAGDFDNISYGVVKQITGSVSDQATLTYTEGGETINLNLWQNNMFAVRFEMRIAVMVRDKNTFVLLTE